MDGMQDRPAARVPGWLRLLLGLVATVAGAAIGGAIAATWTGAMIGLGIALPLVVLGLLMPGVLAAVLFVLQAVSCAS